MIPHDVRKILDSAGLEAIVFEPGSTPTAPEAAEKLGVPVSHIAKSLVVVTKARSFAMIVCPGDRRIANRKLKDLMGAKTRMATPEETFEKTGFKPGAVCPFGVVSMPIYIDTSLAEFRTIYPAAGTDSSGVPMSYEQLIEITGASECDCTELPL